MNPNGPFKATSAHGNNSFPHPHGQHSDDDDGEQQDATPSPSDGCSATTTPGSAVVMDASNNSYWFLGGGGGTDGSVASGSASAARRRFNPSAVPFVPSAMTPGALPPQQGANTAKGSQVQDIRGLGPSSVNRPAPPQPPPPENANETVHVYCELMGPIFIKALPMAQWKTEMENLAPPVHVVDVTYPHHHRGGDADDAGETSSRSVVLTMSRGHYRVLQRSHGSNVSIKDRGTLTLIVELVSKCLLGGLLRSPTAAFIKAWEERTGVELLSWSDASTSASRAATTTAEQGQPTEDEEEDEAGNDGTAAGVTLLQKRRPYSSTASAVGDSLFGASVSVRDSDVPYLLRWHRKLSQVCCGSCDDEVSLHVQEALATNGGDATNALITVVVCHNESLAHDE